MINDKYFFENEKEELKKEAVFRSANALLCGMAIATNLILAGVNIISGNIIGAMLTLFLVILWCLLAVEEVKMFKNIIDLKITFLKDLYRMKVLFMEIDKLEKPIDRQSKTLEEILKEQENGDTKERKCELEQGDTMS